MLKTVILAENPLEPDSWEKVEVADVREFLMSRFDKWPATGRIYHEQVAECNDVTPSDEAGIERLGELPGPFYCVVYPAEPTTIIMVIVAVVAVAVAVTMQPSIPTPSMRNSQATSPNNELSARSNKERIGGRIPDIFGTVRCVPDLIGVPYTTYVNNQEVEHSIMCVGRGQYEILDAYDDVTACSQIAGTSIQVYKPNTFVSSATPYFQVGTPFTGSVYNISRSNSVNGQVLRPPNSNSMTGESDILFKYPDTIRLNSSSSDDFTEVFAANDTITIADAAVYSESATQTKAITTIDNASFKFSIPSSTPPAEFTSATKIELRNATFTTTDSDGFTSSAYELSGVYNVASVSLITEGTAPFVSYWCKVTLSSPSSVNPQWNKVSTYGASTETVTIVLQGGSVLYNLSGTYTVLAVATKSITLANPSAVNADWLKLQPLPSGESPYLSPTLSTSGDKWIGPFILEDVKRNRVMANFVAMQGLYRLTEKNGNQRRRDVRVEIEITPIDANDNPTGSPQVNQITLAGSAVSRETRGVTLNVATSFTGRCKVRARRVTEKYTAGGTVVEEVKWRDLYSVAPITTSNFGNVTIVRSQAYATAGALSLKERKLNMLVTRQIPQRVSGSTFTTELYSTNSAADILSFVCLDKYLGNRQKSEIDFDNFYNTVAEIVSYFGTSIAGQFCYTFDKDNLSFEETVASIANAIFCNAYRRGNVIKLSFEKQTADSTLLFNHRNKLPGSETRTIRFGNDSDYDGIEFEYVSPDDDAILTYYIPSNKSAVNPKKIESIGIRSKIHAHFHAWRYWNKIRYQNATIEFDATQEADLSIPGDRILVADNTRPDTQDGEITGQNGLVINTSQQLRFETGITYVVFLQLRDGTIESIPVAPGPDSYSMLLSRAPLLPLAVTSDLYARTTYILVGNNDRHKRAFLVTEKTPKDNFTSTIRGGNYDDRFYEHDKDFINGLISE